MDKGYVLIGSTALRDSSGEFLESYPLYIKAADAQKLSKECKQDLTELSKTIAFSGRQSK